MYIQTEVRSAREICNTSALILAVKYIYWGNVTLLSATWQYNRTQSVNLIKLAGATFVEVAQALPQFSIRHSLDLFVTSPLLK